MLTSKQLLIVAGLTFGSFCIGLKTQFDHVLTDEEYKVSVGKDYVFFEIIDPEELAYTYKVNPAGFTPSWNITLNGVNLVPTEPPCGCGFVQNSEEVEGRIALMERGDCSFVSKVRRAEEAGAIGAIITDVDKDNDELFISMIDDTTDRPVSIPAAFLLGINGHIIKKTLNTLAIPSAVINIPVNISRISPYKLNQPPWLVW
jgi:hypothetical protein